MADFRNAKYGTDTAELIESLKTIPRNPAKRAPAKAATATKAKSKQSSA